MDLFSLITACAIAVSPAVNTTLYKIASVHTGHPWTIENSQTGDVYIPDTVEQAYGIATALLESGYTVRLGLVQIDGQSARNVYGLNVEQIFDACTNVSIGSDMLDEALKEATSEREALALYAGGKSSFVHSWIEDVLSKPAHVTGEKSIGRIYSAPTSRLFIQPPPQNPYRAPQEGVEQKLFVNTERLNAKTEPEKWESPSSTKNKAPEKPNPSDQLFIKLTPNTKRIGTTEPGDRNGNRKAQVPVTTEKLLTTKELKRSQEETGGEDE